MNRIKKMTVSELLFAILCFLCIILAIGAANWPAAIAWVVAAILFISNLEWKILVENHLARLKKLAQRGEMK